MLATAVTLGQIMPMFTCASGCTNVVDAHDAAKLWGVPQAGSLAAVQTEVATWWAALPVDGGGNVTGDQLLLAAPGLVALIRAALLP
jgi:hypothetical protein